MLSGPKRNLWHLKVFHLSAETHDKIDGFEPEEVRKDEQAGWRTVKKEC